MKKSSFSVIIHHNGGEFVEEKEIVALLQDYRHDVLNELQIVKGYLSIGKTDKAEEKLNKWIHQFDEERRLSNLSIPKWMLWLMTTKKRYANIRLYYTIDVKSNLNLTSIDEQLVHHSEQMTDWLYKVGSKNKLYDINIALKEKTNLSEVLICFYIKDFHGILQTSKEVDFPVRVEHTESGLICEWSYLV